MTKKPTYDELEQRVRELEKTEHDQKLAGDLLGIFRMDKKEKFHQEAQAELIHNVGQRVISKLELTDLLAEIVNAIHDAFNYYGVMLLLIDENKNLLVLQSIVGAYTDIFSDDLSLEVGEGMIGLAAKTGKTQICSDSNKDPNWVQKANELTRSELSIPIMSGKKLIGVLDIQSDELNAFNKGDIVAMETLSTQIAIGIENANLFKKAQSEIEERKIIAEKLKKLNTKLNKANDKLNQLVSIDGLTNIANHRCFQEFYDYEWKRAIRHQKPISIVMIDIDFFKRYNDCYGHQEGDECLKQIAKVIKNCARRSSDLSARYGGEEFIIVLPDADIEEAGIIAESCRNSVISLKIDHKDSKTAKYVTISSGCASVIPEKGHDQSLLIKAADRALYNSKEDGRNRVSLS